MAVVNYSVTNIQTHKDRCHVYSWTGLVAGDTGQPVEMSGRRDRSVQCSGSMGQIHFEGSNDGVSWFLLSDASGQTLSFTSSGLKQVMECCRYMRPNVQSGAGPMSCILFISL